MQGDWTEKLYALASAVDVTAAAAALPAAGGPPPQTRFAARPPSCAPSSGDLQAPHHHVDVAALAHHADGVSSSSNVLLTQSPGSSGVLSSHALQLVRQALDEERRSSTSAGSRSSTDGANGKVLLKPAAAAPTPQSCLSPRAALSMRGGAVPCPGLAKPHFRIDGPYGAPTQVLPKGKRARSKRLALLAPASCPCAHVTLRSTLWSTRCWCWWRAALA